MAIISPITPKQKGIVGKLIKSKKPQKYLNEGTFINAKTNFLPKDNVEYFSPFASTGIKLNRNV